METSSRFCFFQHGANAISTGIAVKDQEKELSSTVPVREDNNQTLSKQCSNGPLHFTSKVYFGTLFEQSCDCFHAFDQVPEEAVAIAQPTQKRMQLLHRFWHRHGRERGRFVRV